MRPVPRILGLLIALSAFLLPFWGNRGPSSTSLVDLTLAPVALWWCWLAISDRRSTPWFTLPALLFVLTGAAAGAVGRYPGQGTLAAATDLYLLLAGLAAARVVGADEAWARRTGLAWVAGAVVSSLPLLLSAWRVFPASAWGLLVTSDHRAFGTFANPNITGSYYAVSVFVLPGFIRVRWLRWALTVPLLMALALTGSIAALIGTALGAGFFLIRAAVRAVGGNGAHPTRRGVAIALAGLCSVVAVGLAAPSIASVPNRVVASPALHNSFGRIDRSDSGRVELWSFALHQLGDRVAIGVGPGASESELRRVSDRAKSLHSDLLAALLERGVGGAFALALLIAAVAASALAAARRHPTLGVAVLTLAPQLLTHEVLHFRHVWLLFGVVAGVQALATAQPRSPA
jgi:O-antigen ligase